MKGKRIKLKINQLKVFKKSSFKAFVLEEFFQCKSEHIMNTLLPSTFKEGVAFRSPYIVPS